MVFIPEGFKMTDKPSKKKQIEKKEEDKDLDRYLNDITTAWNNPEYRDLAYSGTAVSTTTSSASMEAVFGKDSEIYNEWTKVQDENQRYCPTCNKIVKLISKKCPNCGNEL